MSDNLVPLDLIDDNPYQTRQTYDEASIADLAADIYERGLLQPPMGRRSGERIQLAFGHRRLRAYSHIAANLVDPDGPGWSAIPISIQDLSDEQMALYAWSENAQRKDLTAIEEAQAIHMMLDRFDWSQAEIGFKLGIDRSTVANKLRLLRLPADVQAQVASRTLSERQAVALLPMYDLPAALLKNFEKEYPYGYNTPAKIAECAAKSSSDQIRRDVERVIEIGTGDLQTPWAEHAFDERHVKAPACRDCGERVRLDGQMRCPVKSCRERKQALWEALRLAAAHIVCGIRPVDDKPGYADYTTLQHVPQPQRLLEKGCPNLRLRWVGEDANSVTRLRVQGYPDVEVICLHGKDNKCTCASQAKSAATREANQAPDVQALRLERRRIDVELIEPAEAAILAALRADELGVWQAMLHKIVFSNVSDPETVDGCREKIAHALLGDAIFSDLRVPEPNYGTIKEHAEAGLKHLAITPPWATSPVETLRRKYRHIAGWIQYRRWWDFFGSGMNVKAIQGNLDNLNRLYADLVELRDDSSDAITLESEIAVDRDLLLRLLPIAEQFVARPRSGDFLDRRSRGLAICNKLLDAAPGSVDFDGALAQADPLELSYAIALAQGFERLHVLVARQTELAETPMPVL